jgi:hypothetical protein
VQIVASDIGATVTGIDAQNHRQYLLELLLAVAQGALHPGKFAVGLRACGIPVEEGTPAMLAELLWCAPARCTVPCVERFRGPFWQHLGACRPAIIPLQRVTLWSRKTL